jgi:transcriptional regulator with XRE-family HTH domain
MVFDRNCRDMVSAKEIGLSVKALRRAKGMTQAQLAELIGRTTDAVSQIERGVNMPSLDTLMSLGEGLSVPVDALLQVSDDKKANIGRTDHIREANAILQSLSDDDLQFAVQILNVFNLRRRS